MNINEEMDGVEVRMMQRPNGTRFMKVLVRSYAYPTMKKVGEIDEDPTRNDRRTTQRVGVLAGAIAEEIAEQYGDKIEPSNVARAAMEACREMLLDQRRVLLEVDEEA